MIELKYANDIQFHLQKHSNLELQKDKALNALPHNGI